MKGLALKHPTVMPRSKAGKTLAAARAEREEGRRPTQEFELHSIKQRDIDEGFRSREHREQAQRQDFVHRTKHLAALARVRQLPEMKPVTHFFSDCPSP